MKHPFNDRRTLSLLQRVSEDLSTLGGDIATLLGDTTRRAIPEGAREVSKMARQKLSAGGSYAKNHLPTLVIARKPPALGVLGGTLAVGTLAALAWYLVKDRNAAAEQARLRDLEFGPQGIPTNSGEI